MEWQKFVAGLFLANILTAGTLHLKTRTIETTDMPADYQAGAEKHWRSGISHFLLQFRAPVSDADRQALADRGASITGTVPDNAIVVAAGGDFSGDGLDLEFAGRLRAWDKVSPLVLNASEGAAFVIEFHADVNAFDAIQLLGQQNLAILPHADLAPNHFLVSGATRDVLGLQDWDEIAYIFPASDELMAGEHVLACAGALSGGGGGEGISAGQYVLVGHGWPKDSSGTVTLGYFYSQLTANVPAQTTKAEIQRALAQWAKYAPLRYRERTSATAAQTMNIWFASGDHQDGFPFTSEILGHTFYPSNPEPIAGDMHLNMNEPWHSGGNVDIYTVVLHEAGHALGLGHSDKPGSIMYPYYRLGAQISADDIAGIQAIYGTPAAAPVTPVLPLSLTIAPAPAQTQAASIALSGTVGNAVGQSTVTWETDRKASGQASGTASWSAASVPLITGANTITVTVTDANHRTATQSVTVARTAPPVSAPAAVQAPPSIALISPAMTIVQTTQASLTVTGTSSATAVRVTWQNGPMGTGPATGIGTWTASVPLITGTNNVVLKAVDAAGNSGWRSLTVIRR